ncbi:predicted protein [Coccidioides posadasii str. Silveira]|uniref:Predicted protein n=1 Tax=Coccidioides posadasii (strain RMSCC 757 / Silveira) TaxID=443226 RepID=E9CS02_COCPS|nr:predicted protein [Coccidioides posadasii str. Silveira]
MCLLRQCEGGSAKKGDRSSGLVACTLERMMNNWEMLGWKPRKAGRKMGAGRDSVKYSFLILPAGGQSTADGDLIETDLPFFGARRQWGINAEPADALPEMKELGPFLVALYMGWFACWFVRQ